MTGPPNLTATAWPERPVEVVVDDEATARCCFVKARCAHFLQPARKDKRVGLVPDPNLALFVTAAQGGSDPMIAGNGDLVSGERYRACELRLGGDACVGS